MRRILMSRCSFENPSSLDKFLRTRSPSSSVTGRPPISRNFVISALAMVDLPDPESPVKKMVTPCLCRGGGGESSGAVSGKVFRSERAALSREVAGGAPGRDQLQLGERVAARGGHGGQGAQARGASPAAPAASAARDAAAHRRQRASLVSG